MTRCVPPRAVRLAGPLTSLVLVLALLVGGLASTALAQVSERDQARAALDAKESQLAAQGISFGARLNDADPVNGGWQRRYAGGHLYWSAATGAHFILGAILGRYLALGGASGLGLPTTDELAVAGARKNEFARAHIYWSSGTGARFVFGAILAKYVALGGPAALGLPTTDEIDVPGGRASFLQRAHIYWSGPTGAHVVLGAVLGRYLALGGPGSLGLPTTDEMDVPGGRASLFERTHIYWAPSTGALFVFGAILGRYVAIGGSNALGLPVTDEYSVPGGRRSDFQEGSIVWDAATGATSVFGRAPNLAVQQVAGGLSIPWDLGFTPDGTILFTERGGRLCVLANGGCRQVAVASNAYVNSEGGVLGMAIDPDFATNRSFWVCQTFQTGGNPVDVRVYRWSVNATYTVATREPTPVVFGLPISSGRHSGCRPRFGPDGHLWIGTGDATQGPWPQNRDFPNERRSQGGKILRLDEDTGQGVAGNVRGPIYSYGHRNVQGLAFRPGTGQAFSAEHGPDGDDEINRLQPGDFGWNPVSSAGGLAYNENVPMTRAGAIPAIWSSGVPTLATSGATFVTGSSWGRWNGALVVACLKTTQLLTLTLDTAGNVVTQVTSEVPGYEGFRLRSAVQGPDGSLYVTTSNGGDDRILRLTPS